jgi:peptidoglycan/LPS O-acetylase OafA/YrhL
LHAKAESPNLDLLRSFAVLFVLIFHVLLYFQHTVFPHISLASSGHWGVLIFFVHTSLVLMFSLERQNLRAPGEPFIGEFFARRIFRIYPLSILIVLLIALLRLPVGHLHSGKFIFVNLSWPGLLSNLVLLQDLTHTDSIIAVLWSLPYELRMYLFLPFLYLLAKWIRSPLPILLAWSGAVVLAKHSAFFERHGFSDFLIYVPCFLSGVIAYKLSSTRRLSLPSWLWPCALAILSVVFLKNASVTRAWWCCLALGVVLPQFREISNPFFRKLFLLIARYSYGIYLTHFVFIWLVFDRLSSLPFVAQIALFVACVVASSMLLYHTIEEPAIRAGHKVILQFREKRTLSVVPAVEG